MDNVTQIISQHYGLHGVASSLIGGRPEQQDDMGWTDTPLGFLLVVCDGMGGGPGGKTASYIAKNVFMQTLLNAPADTTRGDVMKQAVYRANEALYKKMDEVPALRGMGSTLVAVLVSEESALVAHLGDSRCYQIRGEKMLFRTRDHSLVGELVEAKAITEEEARVSPQSNVITRALGNTENHVPEIDEVPFQRGDRFVLCSDGVWGVFPHKDLMLRLTAHAELATLADKLQAEVDKVGFAGSGHHDNHTLAIIEMNMDSQLKEKMSKQAKLIIAALGAVLALCLFLNGTTALKLNKERKLAEKIQTEIALQKEQIRVLENEKKTLRGSQDAISAQMGQQDNELSLLRTERDSLQKELDATRKAVVNLVLREFEKVGSVKGATETELKIKLRNIHNTITSGLKALSTVMSTEDVALPSLENTCKNINEDKDKKTYLLNDKMKKEYGEARSRFETQVNKIGEKQ